MYSIQTVGNTGPCLGVSGPTPEKNKLAAISNPNNLPNDKYPAMDGDLRQHATICPSGNQADCSAVPNNTMHENKNLAVVSICRRHCLKCW
jgi:hypothetical protein